MSVQTARSKTDSCARDGCDVTFNVYNAVDGSYCSRDCADAASGAALLKHIQTDHKYCASCFGVKKDIEPPKPESEFKESGGGWVPTGDDSATLERYGQEVTIRSAVGFEHVTERAERGPWGVECICGAVSHDAVDEDFRRHEPYLWNIVTTIDHLREERDKTTAKVDVVTLADALWRGLDLELAVGRALQD